MQPFFICLVLNWRMSRLYSCSQIKTIISMKWLQMFVQIVASRNGHHCGMLENLWCPFPGNSLRKQHLSPVLPSAQASTAGQIYVRATLVCPTVVISARPEPAFLGGLVFQRGRQRECTVRMWFADSSETALKQINASFSDKFELK